MNKEHNASKVNSSKHIDNKWVISIALLIFITSAFIGFYAQYRFAHSYEEIEKIQPIFEESLLKDTLQESSSKDNKNVRRYSKKKPIREEKDFEMMEPKSLDIDAQKVDSETLDMNKIERRKKNIRNNFSDYISTRKSTFLFKQPTGVYDVTISVENNSEFPIDLIMVDLQYISMSLGVIQTNQVFFENISPNQRKNIKAYNNDQATSINIIISTINSKALNFCYSIDKSIVNKLDPYQCNE